MTFGLDNDGSGWYDDALTARDAVSDGKDINNGKAWTYGKEVWCNLEGRYMHIIADLSHLFNTYSSYTMSLCQLGIMGTEYVRAETPQSEITLI